MALRRTGPLRQPPATSSTRTVVESMIERRDRRGRPQSANFTNVKTSVRPASSVEPAGPADGDIDVLLATILSRNFNRKTYGEMSEIRARMIEILLQPEVHRSLPKFEELSAQEGPSISHSHQNALTEISRLHKLNSGVFLSDWLVNPGNFLLLRKLVRRRISEILSDVCLGTHEDDSPRIAPKDGQPVRC